ncbi:MAG: hypothetical protein C7B45_01330 [Sulfobacillus acidophilus]|uniref:Uncharacterized protein n=1 Tax=Sulfobacillus acidophilus TaxID=53633 RepID=A0A2T2WNX5_9FIRM|nr:MAG: hypothetical protein C7B45_01330 [Sulfobacillus acidophilus]
MKTGWDRYSQETRYLLDVVSFAVHLAAPQNRVIGVHAAARELFLDLQDRLSPQYSLLWEKDPVSTKSGVIHLLSWESGLSELHLSTADFVVLAMRNRCSFKSLKYGKRPSESLVKALRLLRRDGFRVQSWGVYAPGQLAWYEIALTVRRLNRHDLAFYLSDRGDLSPVVHGGWWARWANYGVLMGVRD